MQAARLEPALKLALDAIAEGRIEAIDRLIRVLAAQDRYLTAPASLYGGEDVREQLIARLDMAARPLSPEIEAKMNAPVTTIASP